MTRLKILMLAAEAAPLVKVGGLGDVLGALPRALQLRGHDVRLALPHYLHIPVSAGEPVADFHMPWNGRQARVLASEVRVGDVTAYLVRGRPVTEQPSVYGAGIEQDGPKFVFYSVAALELARAVGFRPDVLHVHDSHPGAAIYWLSQQRARDEFWSGTASVLTIHNLPFQNNHAGDALAMAGLAPSRDAAIPRWARDSLMALGINYADEVNAVSPGYAQEIMGNEFGAGLDGLLAARARRPADATSWRGRQSVTRADGVTGGHVRGILNGLDYDLWDPETDSALPAAISPRALAARAANKVALQRELGLLGHDDVPLFGVVSRLDHQKGFDLLAPALQPLLAHGRAQLAVLGAGAPEIERSLRQLQDAFPRQVALALRFDAQLARRIYGGCDIFVMPSRYEPCGIGQMIAMRYGAVPVVRATGGLRDTVVDYDVDRRRSTGLVFEEYSRGGLRAALVRATIIFGDRRRWRGLMRRGMALRFSWERSAAAYEAMYAAALRALPPKSRPD